MGIQVTPTPMMELTTTLSAMQENHTLISASSMMRSEECTYGFDALKLLNLTNIIEEDELTWPCELREYWVSILPLVNLAQTLLYYGTTVVVTVGLAFNLIIICTLSTKKMRHVSTNLYLLALGVYDSCVLIFNFLVGVLRAQNPETVNRAFQENEWLCLTHSVVVELFNLLSVWMIVCFTIERLIVVYFPLKAAKLCSIRRTKLVIVLVSLFVLLVSFYKIFVSGFETDSVFGYKACATNRIKYSDVIYLYVGLKTWLPILVMIILNSLIARQLHSSAVARRQFSVTNRRRDHGGTSQEARITRTLLAVSLIYIILLLPLGVVLSVELCAKSFFWQSPSVNAGEQAAYIAIQKKLMLLKWVRGICFVLYQLNYGINFLIYMSSNKKFRSVIIRKWQKLFPHNADKKRTSVTSTTTTRISSIQTNPTASTDTIDSNLTAVSEVAMSVIQCGVPIPIPPETMA